MVTPSYLFSIVMEYADGGDLFDKITHQINQREYFSENWVWTILIQSLLGLEVLHEMKILHWDLKCANVFLMKNGDAKLGDLNVSKVLKNELCLS